MTDENPLVEFEVPVGEFARSAGMGIPEGTPVRFAYDSAYGGDVEVDGDLVIDDELFGPRRVIVADRWVDASGRVRSVDGDRRVGDVDEVTIQIDREYAIDLSTRHTDGHDVDEAEDVTYVQAWEGRPGSPTWASKEVELRHVD